MPAPTAEILRDIQTPLRGLVFSRPPGILAHAGPPPTPTMPMPGADVSFHRGVFSDAEPARYIGLTQGRPNYVTIETASGERVDLPASRVNYRARPLSSLMGQR